ncbi:MAG: hypothetical protein GQE15_25520 [Archangiaceae bacterium]|nr:hypothetical protein [Archangiaceae bacterium]
MTRLIPLVVVVCISACNATQIGECVGTAVGQAIGNVGLAKAREGGKNPTRPDEAFLIADAGSYISVAHAGGRLGIEFAGVVSTGELPRRTPDCALTDYALFHASDGGITHVFGTVTVAEQTQTDAGTRIRLETTNLRLSFSDGGTLPLGERQVDVIAR